MSKAGKIKIPLTRDDIISLAREYNEISRGRGIRQPDDISVADICAELGCGKETALKFIRQMVKDGKVKQIKVRGDGPHAYIKVYRPV